MESEDGISGTQGSQQQRVRREMLLHQNVGRIGGETREPLGSTSTPRQGEKCKKCEYL